MGQSIEKILCSGFGFERREFLFHLFSASDVKLEAHAVTYRMLPSVFVQLLLCFASETTLWARVGSFSTVVHEMLFQLKTKLCRIKKNLHGLKIFAGHIVITCHLVRKPLLHTSQCSG